MSEETMERSPGEEVAIVLLMCVCCASGILTWLAFAGWWYRGFVELLRLAVALAVVFAAAVAYLLWNIRYSRACPLASKLKTLSLVGYASTYFFLLFVHACFFAGPVVYAIGFALTVLGLAFRVFAVGVKAAAQEGVLITWGPYGLVRHPRYLGTFLAIFGTCLTLRPLPLVLVLALLPVLLHLAVALREEAYFHNDSVTGAYYEQYSRKVPAFWPSRASSQVFLREVFGVKASLSASALAGLSLIILIAVLRAFFPSGGVLVAPGAVNDIETPRVR